MGLSPSSLTLFGDVMTWLNPLWMVAVGVVVALVVLFALFLLLQRVLPWVAGKALSAVRLPEVGLKLRLALPRVAAITRITAKEALSQPVFYVVLAVAAFGLLLSPFIPYNTFGDDIKMIKDTGLTWIMIWSLVVALWTAGVSIADEIEGRTALTLLSKPVGRWSFILGKFLGIVGAVAILFIILGALFLGTVSYKVVYDARENCLPDPTRQDCADQMEHILPGLALAFLETTVLTSIGVAISTRLPILANLIICVSIYVLGHLVPMLVNSTVGQLEIVAFVGTFLATILPVLDHFNVYTAISRYTPGSPGGEIPWSYVGMATLYCVLYSAAAMLLALLLFEDRDLA